MKFAKLAEYFANLEKITSRNEMTVVLSLLFKAAEQDTIGKICYLLQGRVVPLYESLEFGMADKMVIRAIGEALNASIGDVTKVFKLTGDLGFTVEELRVKNKELRINKNTTVIDIFALLHKMASTTGEGSQDEKIKLLAEIIKSVDSLSARYIVRIVLAKLRLGFSDMTMLDGLSWMLVGSKGEKERLEKAYNVRPDLAFVAETVKAKGIAGLSHIKPNPGTPIMMARANRLSSAHEIIEKIGQCAVEYKYDGLRVQAHYKRIKNSKSNYIKLFSRNLEDMTKMFPDICEAIKKQITTDSAIFEGEIVAYNPETGVFVPFQETMQRKRKYDIQSKAAEIPVKLFAFEILYIDGKSLLDEPYRIRKKQLQDVIKSGSTIVYAQEELVSTDEKIEEVFDDSIRKHFEGIIAKKLDGLYEAGMRGWSWIKFKKAMSKKLMDTVDVLVMGYTKGEGKRTDFGVGQFLTGVYDLKQEKYVTISKIGTGLTDEQFREFYKRVHKLETKEKPQEYDVEKLLTPDVWLKPGLVVEVSCDEITRSAVHSAGRVMEPSKSGKALSVKLAGFALRFPRLERFRDDKRPEDATSVKELESMFAAQSKR